MKTQLLDEVTKYPGFFSIVLPLMEFEDDWEHKILAMVRDCDRQWATEMIALLKEMF